MDSFRFVVLTALLALTAALPTAASAQVVISIEPQSQTVYDPDNVLVMVAADNSGDMYGFQFDLMFNSSFIEYQGVNEGGLLSQGNPSSVFCNPPQVSPGMISNFVCTRIVSGNASSSGVLAVFNFSIAGHGTDAVDLSGIKLSNMYSEPLDFSYAGGEVTTSQCQDGDNFTCGPLNETGECRFGNRTCVSGVLQACQDAVMPSDEVCDGIDNDCSGVIDDLGGGDSVQATGCQCFDGASPLADEVCPHNGIDDDCDGSTDETTCPGDEDDGNGGVNGGGGGGCTDGQTRSCSGQGICPPATETCTGGVWGPCTGSREPTDEVCNGIDDDCNGMIDDGADCCTTGQSRECGPSSETGECRKGTSTCENGIWGQCEGSVNPAPETCDSLDNDCDGEVDENCDAGTCQEGLVPRDGCICEGQFRPDGYCCSGLYFEDGCPFSWIILIYAGVIILIVLYAIVLYLKSKGEELTWDAIKSI